MIEFLQPDDFHHHLRDGQCFRDLVQFATKSFDRVVVMPNLKPPVRSVTEAREYYDRIMACVNDNESTIDFTIKGSNFKPLMTLYLTDATTSADIISAKNSGLIYAYKLYPAGATTNSEYGVTSLDRILEALQVDINYDISNEPHHSDCICHVTCMLHTKTMCEVDLPLLVHGEVVDPAVDVFDREAVFIDTVLKPIVEQFPSLRIVMEHITTINAVEFIKSRFNKGLLNIAATITAHHLLYNRSDIFKGGICPHMYCLPILKRETHRRALLEAATSGIPLFFIGDDDAVMRMKMMTPSLDPAL